MERAYPAISFVACEKLVLRLARGSRCWVWLCIAAADAAAAADPSQKSCKTNILGKPTGPTTLTDSPPYGSSILTSYWNSFILPFLFSLHRSTILTNSVKQAICRFPSVSCFDAVPLSLQTPRSSLVSFVQHHILLPHHLPMTSARL